MVSCKFDQFIVDTNLRKLRIFGTYRFEHIDVQLRNCEQIYLVEISGAR